MKSFVSPTRLPEVKSQERCPQMVKLSTHLCRFGPVRIFEVRNFEAAKGKNEPECPRFSLNLFSNAQRKAVFNHARAKASADNIDF